ncbi:uncharacterized protein LOC127845388 [Dreissena polymorpha]|uniref:Uncharacterized protein n=1 Tax=Dreissena polymorpha TaxID=45954 RepID=A0A9D4E4T7_DREPO|nr:uncharacterized protein LOC127845388 [Dreissena polymorpha]KAH3771960.1 hypothetical protein DPMN_173290 [Dreissena polymorpha]
MMSWIRIPHVPLAILLVTVYQKGDCILDGTIVSDAREIENGDNTSAPLCKFSAWERSKSYFDVQFHESDPVFVKFNLTIREKSVVELSHTDDVILPHNWVWTYSTDKSNYPYLSWYIDYGVVSFSLLDARTLELDYLALDVIPVNRTENCRLIIGDNASMINVAKALFEIVVTNNPEHPYRKHFFCYLTKLPKVDNFAGLYFNFPTNVFQYSCCIFDYSYTEGKYSDPECNQKQQKWTLCTTGPYFAGIILLAFCPIFVFQFLTTVGKHEICQPYDFNCLIDTPLTLCQDIQEEDMWIFLDGRPPLRLFDLPSRLLSDLKENRPLTYSRLSRLLCVLIAPVLLFVRVLLFKDGIGSKNTVTVDDLVAKGTPLGFLTILAKYEHARQTFVPILGGPWVVLGLFYILGIIIIVAPNSFKQIIENGTPTKRTWSPLFFGVDEVLRMAMLEPETAPGYSRASEFCRGSFLMLFNGLFWKRVCYVNKKRFLRLIVRYKIAFILLVIPVTVLSFLEFATCLIYNAVPFFSGGVILMKGYIVSILDQINYHFGSIVFSCKFSVVFIICTCSILFCLFLYILCLIFLESFIFISQITIMCFVAVVVFPSSSFGYLFFVVAILYYVTRLIRSFGNVYLELLSIAVEQSVVSESHIKSSAYENTSQKVPYDDTVCGNDVQNTSGTPPGTTIHRTRQRKNLRGIPRSLFEYLINKHRPLYLHVLKLLLSITLIIALWVVTLYILDKFNVSSPSERSDVMHVVFVVIVGALPRVLEVVFIDESDVIKRQVEETKIAKSIERYWNCQTVQLENCA